MIGCGRFGVLTSLSAITAPNSQLEREGLHTVSNETRTTPKRTICLSMDAGKGW